MKLILVLLVSDQAAQNVLFIKEQKARLGKIDFFHFISTKEMEKIGKKVSTQIAISSGLSEEHYKISEVEEDSLNHICDILNKDVPLDSYSYYIVNITGGTKIMSLSAYTYFNSQNKSKIYYLPISKNTINEINSLSKNESINIKEKITLWEYFTAYGIKIQNKNWPIISGLTKPFEVSREILKSYRDEEKRNKFLSITRKAHSHGLRGKKFNKDKNNVEFRLWEDIYSLVELGMSYGDATEISKDETKYITGDWLEEYVYYTIKDYLNIKDKYIGCGLNLSKNETPNEYDVIFLENNTLYVIECKTDISDSSTGKENRISYLYTNTIYKAATLKKEFGLKVNYYLFALNDFSSLSKDQKDRADQLDIKLLGSEIIFDEDKYRDYIMNMCK